MGEADRPNGRASLQSHDDGGRGRTLGSLTRRRRGRSPATPSTWSLVKLEREPLGGAGYNDAYGPACPAFAQTRLPWASGVVPRSGESPSSPCARAARRCAWKNAAHGYRMPRRRPDGPGEDARMVAELEALVSAHLLRDRSGDSRRWPSIARADRARRCAVAPTSAPCSGTSWA